MFGYIKPDPDELKVKEYNTYKAIYCGLCKCTGKCVSCSARFALSYDIVFLSLLRIVLTKERPAFETGRCIAHPLKKRVYALRSDTLQYCAKAGAMLTYYKYLDDLADTHGAGRLKYRLLLPYAKNLRKKAAGLDELGARMETYLGVLSNKEARNEPSVDAPAEIFGRLLAETGAYGLPEREARIANEVCFRIGKWIYFADALDDYESDRLSGNYNPLALSYKDDLAGAKENARCAMALERTRAMAALSLADAPDPGAMAILTNILCAGLPKQEIKISDKLEKDHDRSL